MEEAALQLHLPEQEVSFCGEALLSQAFLSFNQTSWVPTQQAVECMSHFPSRGAFKGGLQM